MTTSIKINSKNKTSDIVLAIFKMIALLAGRSVENILFMFRFTYNWLNSSHDFNNEEGNIRLTGWQCVWGFFGITFLCLLLTIKY